MKESLIEWIRSFYEVKTKEGSYIDETAFEGHSLYWTLTFFGAMVLASLLIWYASRFILIKVLHRIAGKTSATWDDHLMHNKVFKGFALMVPLLFMEFFLSIVFYAYPEFIVDANKIVLVLLMVVGLIVVNRLFNALRDIIMEIEQYRDKPIQSYTQVMKIVLSGILIIMLLSILTNRSPVFFLTSLGAISAILLLIFKDTILGFVGSIQLSTNDMIRIGDWVTMEKFGADGDVEEINLTTVKIRNFDRTITTIPTYSFISDSFINWRGMQESDGRRIKRSIFVQIDSIKFASAELIERLKDVKILAPFIEQRQKEIEEYNATRGLTGGNVLNQRKQTNIGLYRRYLHYYLLHNPNINTEMTLMVRQLAPKENGLPLEIYCFTKTKVWEEYEEVIADIFDHLFAVTNNFELRLFELPSGHDVKALTFKN